MRETDVLVLGRLWRRRYLRYLEYARSHRKPVIYDIDDDSLGIPEGHEDYPRFQKPRVRKAIERFIADADAVTVSTPELAAKLSEFNERIHVVENRLDHHLFPAPVERGADEPVCIGYAGTATHARDFEPLEPVLAEILNQAGGRVRLLFLGYIPERFRNTPYVRHVPATSSYPEYARLLPSLGIDIGLAPLEDSGFNRCKSATKFMEYAASGITGIYAGAPQYKRYVRHGENGYLAGDGRPDEWRELLESLISEPERVRAMGRAARNEVVKSLSVESCIANWRDVYLEVIQRGPRRAARLGPLFYWKCREWIGR